MKTVWTKGLEGDAQRDMVGSYRASTVLRRKLHSICKDKAESAFKLGKEGYNCPNWQLMQADTIGYQRALKEIQSLIEES